MISDPAKPATDTTPPPSPPLPPPASSAVTQSLQRNLAARRGLFIHAFIFAVAAVNLLVLNLLTNRDTIWAVWPIGRLGDRARGPCRVHRRETWLLRHPPRRRRGNLRRFGDHQHLPRSRQCEHGRVVGRLADPRLAALTHHPSAIRLRSGLRCPQRCQALLPSHQALIGSGFCLPQAVVICGFLPYNSHGDCACSRPTRPDITVRSEQVRRSASCDRKSIGQSS